MLDFLEKILPKILNFFKKIFPNQSERNLQALYTYITTINQTYETLRPLSNDQLRQQTQLLKQELKEKTGKTYNTIINLQQQAKQSNNITEKTNLFQQADNLQKKYQQQIEKTLLELLPRAFAIIKETTRRFKENTTLRVQATDYDKALAKQHKHITIIDDEACWHNTWQAGGQNITWNMVPYDVQLIGGIVLHQGKIAEMATGEGKTLVAILPTYLNALTGQGVHVITVNDYLAKRDAAWVGPIYQFHGLTIDCIDLHPSHSPKRKQAYQADITYGTNNEFIFDYLRDNLATTLQEQVQTKRNVCIADEADYIWIDDARTPCIISGQATHNDVQAFYTLQPRVHQLYKAQYKLINDLLQQAKQHIKDNNTKQAGLNLFRIYRGLPKHEPFIHYLSEKGMKKLLDETENIYLEENNRRMPEADQPLYFTIEEKQNTIQLTEKGTEYLTQHSEDPNLFILPDIATQIAQIENDTKLTNQQKITAREQLNKNYSQKAARINTVHQLLKAYALFQKNVDYILINQQVKIVDEKTGRILIGRRYSDGLHQAIEAKENVTVQELTQTCATITPQNYFRMYRKLAGMTGTAETEAKELWDIYNLQVVVIPTHKPVIRQDKDDKIYRTKQEKLNAIAQEVYALQQQGRPVLVGTSSVESSEEMRKKLKLSTKQVLNAKNHKIESQIVARAGQQKTITVVTHMAGRGTDIKLSKEAKAAGGLAIIGAERHENRRVDRQLRGRAGRQGDPGSSQFFVDLESNLMAHFNTGLIGSQLAKMFPKQGEAIQDPLITRAIGNAQKRLEENAFAYRKRQLEYDDVMNMQRTVIYKKRQHALHHERLNLDIMHMLYHTLTNLINKAKLEPNNHKRFQLDIIATLNIIPHITPQDLINQNEKTLIKKLYQQAYNNYLKQQQHKQQQLHQLLVNITQTNPTTPNQLPLGIPLDPQDPTKLTHTTINLTQAIASQGKTAIQAIESSIVLHTIDEYWKQHLQKMDALKEATRNAVYEQKDPLLMYKIEGFELFKNLIDTINKDTITHLCATNNENITQHTHHHPEAIYQNLHEHKVAYDNSQQKNTPPLRSTKIASRNQRVTVKYTDGRIKKNVKFKTIEQDLHNKQCTLIQT